MSAFVPIPALDLFDGQCVRLLRGDFDAATPYGDPVELARGYEAEGAAMLHLVDLDAARSGEAGNGELVARIVDALSIPVQLGGGIRDERRAEEALASGVERIVLGTRALEDAALVETLAARHPGRIVVGLDHRRIDAKGHARRVLAVRGWAQDSGIELLEALSRFAAMPLAGVVVTDIGRDGTLAGPDLEGYLEALSHSELALIASGGIGTLADLDGLARLEANGRHLYGAVIGRALLSGAFGFAEALARARAA